MRGRFQWQFRLCNATPEAKAGMLPTMVVRTREFNGMGGDRMTAGEPGLLLFRDDNRGAPPQTETLGGALLGSGHLNDAE